MAHYLNQYLADLELSEKDYKNEINSILRNPDYNYEDIIPKAISTELICAERLVLRNSILVAIHPEFQDTLLGTELEDYDTPEKMIDKYLDSHLVSKEEEVRDNLRRLVKARSLNRELNRQIRWLLENASTLRRESSSSKPKSSKIETKVVKPRIELHRYRHFRERK